MLVHVGGALSPSIGLRRGVCAHAERAVASVVVATTEIAENNHIEVQILAAAALKVATSPRRKHGPSPLPLGRGPGSRRRAQGPPGRTTAPSPLRSRIFDTPRSMALAAIFAILESASLISI
jgi:hypothetical protein